jgi:hypothetical protein
MLPTKSPSHRQLAANSPPTRRQLATTQLAANSPPARHHPTRRQLATTQLATNSPPTRRQLTTNSPPTRHQLATNSLTNSPNHKVIICLMLKKEIQGFYLLIN